MKKVLIPFDFGPVGLNAIRYAFDMFGNDAEYLVLHIIDGNLSLNDPLTYTAGLTRGDSLIHEMNRIVDEVRQSSVSYDCKIEVGSVVESLVKSSEKGGFDVVVMGTRHKYDLLDKWLGTVSLGIVKRVKLPVYLIPKDASFKSYDRVVIATDHHLESDHILDYLLEWNKAYKSDFHFVHIIDDKGREEGFLKNIVEEFFEKRNLDFPFTVVQKERGRIADELIKYSADHKASLQILITDKMSWLETMMSSSVSKKMILKARKPILFLPSGMRKYSQVLLDIAVI